VAADCIAEMRRIQPTGPYRLLGHSFGGIVCHAMAAQLQEVGERVGLIVSLDGEPARKLTPEETEVFEDTGRIYAGMLELLGVAPEEIPGESLTYQQFTEVARTTRTALGSLSEEDVMAMMRLIRHNGRLAATYQHERVATDMLVFAAADKDTPILTEDMWRDHVDGEIDYHLVDYKHHTIMTPAALGRLVPIIEERLRTSVRQQSRTQESEKN
jgi:thioesterase domain-containing protein